MWVLSQGDKKKKQNWFQMRTDEKVQKQKFQNTGIHLWSIYFLHSKCRMLLDENMLRFIHLNTINNAPE